MNFHKKPIIKTNGTLCQKEYEPTKDPTSQSKFPIIGIGSSAGGLKALEEFFSHFPEITSIPSAFVLVQHMHPDHKSLLCDLIKKYTPLQVCEATDGVEVEPHVIYINPPNRDIMMCQGRLLLSEIKKTQGLHLPIDGFFRSLAEDQKDRSICIVLSGSGSDGTLGLKAIKGEGGMTMVQDPDSAEHKGMPSSAIGTGMADYILPPKEMPEMLIAYIHHAFASKRSGLIAPSVPKDNASLQKILALLHTQTGHDFSGYKLNTITRRLERRLAVNLIKNLNHYYRYLQKNPLEVKALFQDLLVGVTCFFREPEAFEKLKGTVIPQIFAEKGKDHYIRVWVPGCSTGEEAYSLAILFHEYMEKAKQPLQIKIFATDIDSRAIEYARSGFYPANIASDISPERLNRYFSPTDGNTYHINSMIREMVIFAEQSITGDPPFSNIDLISCRNVLIYLDREMQSKVLHLFHYALKHNGFLFLGTSETTGDFIDFFNTVDRKWKIYQSKGNIGLYQTLKNYSAPYIKNAPLSINSHQQEKKVSIREIAEKTLLRDYAPASVITGSHGDILYFHGRTGKYLEPVQGDANMNILQMARKGLKVELATALRKANVQKQPSYFQGLHVSGNGQTFTINLKVTPVNEGSELTMVAFEEVVPPESASSSEVAATSQYGVDEKMADMERELQNKEEYLQTIIEELETSNEELQSTNEEFQSTNEELETSKEELGSLNEELMTVNAELQQKNDELTQLNNDLNNLLAGTGVATIFIDHNLCIQRFTPTSTQIINLIASDVGRPVSHIANNLTDYDHFVEDVQLVLDTLIPKEVEIQSKKGNWYLMRILPYRTLSNAIEGAVVNFMDITEQKNVQKLSRLAVIVQDSSDAITLQDLKGKILAWNPGAEKLYGWSENEALAMNIRETIPEDLRKDVLKVLQELTTRDIVKPFKTQRLTKHGKTVNVWINPTVLLKDEEPYAIATTERESD